MRLIRSSAGLCMMLLAFSVHTETMAAPFVPGSPCNGCTVEIFDHTGVLRTAKNAVFRVSNPQTPNGPAPFLELYNPTLAMIEDCAAKVDSIRKPAPGSVVMNAREYQLSGSNQVVFLIEDCEGGGGPGSGEGGPIDEQDDPSLGPIDDGSGLGCAGSGDVHYTPGMCADLGSNPASVSGPGWQTVTHTLSEAHCNLGYADYVNGPGKLVLYDNTYTVMCDEGNYAPDVYVGETAADSNWGAYTTHNETCKMKTGPRPSDGTRVIETIVCPAPDDGHRDDGDGRHDDRGADGRTDAQREWDDRGADGRPDDRGDEQAIDSTVVEVKEISGIELTVEGSEVDGPEYQVPTVDETAEDNADDVGIEAGVEQNCTLDQPCHITRIELTVEGSEVDGPEYQGQQ